MRRSSALGRWLALSILSGSLLVSALAYLFVQNYFPTAGSIRLNAVSLWIVDDFGNPVYATQTGSAPEGWRAAAADGPRLVAGKTPKTFLLTLRLSGSPPVWAVAEVKGPLIQPEHRTTQIIRGSLIVLLLITANLAVAAALLVLWSRRKGKIAAGVLSELERGNLTARFPTTRADELGRLMAHFNRMADKIESLVVSLREAETARTRLLRELAHDVRTPLTALRGVVETVRDCLDRLTPGEIEKRMEQAEGELTYFERLIEDLFLLAELGDPKARRTAGIVDLAEIVRQEIETARSRVELLTPNQVRFSFSAEGAAMVSGDEHLLRRLIRNALENALEHAKARIEVSLEGSSSRIALVIRDDGPGLDESSLRHFGQRRASRFVDDRRGKKISLGLGSVIMKAIAEGHQGSLQLGNRAGSSGAELRFSLPALLEERRAA